MEKRSPNVPLSSLQRFVFVHGASVAHQTVRWSPVRGDFTERIVVIVIGIIYIIATYRYATRLVGIDRRGLLGNTGYTAVDAIAGDDGVVDGGSVVAASVLDSVAVGSLG